MFYKITINTAQNRMAPNLFVSKIDRLIQDEGPFTVSDDDEEGTEYQLRSN